MKKLLAACLSLFMLVSCSPAMPPEPTNTPIPLPTAIVITLPPRPTVTPYPTRSQGIESTPTETATPASTIYEPYSIQALRSRTYGGGSIEETKSEPFFGFTRHNFHYQSDGLNITGYINVPEGPGPYPVIFLIHGYAPPENYETLGYLTDLADGLAQGGYNVIYPDMRNYPPSDKGDDFFRVGYAVDVLNLIALVKENSGKPGLLEKVDSNQMGMIGHSMGGGVVLRVITVNPDIKAAVLYASISGDEQKNSELFLQLTGSEQNKTELASPTFAFAQISPVGSYYQIKAAVRLFHGSADAVVPFAWAQENCLALRAAVKDMECTFYEGAEHTFRSRYNFPDTLLKFFNKYLKGQ